MSTDLHDAAINASICPRASQASIQSAGVPGIATHLQGPLEEGEKEGRNKCLCRLSYLRKDETK